MRCLRCGICCTTHMVVIVKDPKLGPVDGNLEGRSGSERCRHLLGSVPPYSCAVHDEEWYPETPCARHGQIERHSDEYCRLGNFHLNGKRIPERAPKAEASTP